MQRLANTSGSVVRQKKHIGETLLGIEAKSKFSIHDLQGQPLFFASEVGGSFFTRQLLKTLRPFSMEFQDDQEQCLLKCRRPFRWFFHQLQVTEPGGKVVGTVQREWSWVRRIYTVKDSQDRELFTLLGPVLKPWTFNVLQQGNQIGAIRKKWSGLLTEAFTQADNFGVEWPASLPVEHKALLLGAVFLIDIMYFEAKD